MTKVKLTKIALIVLFICQILDGLLTYAGITHFGTLQAEGNPILRIVMESLGILPGLISVKIIACIILIVVYTRIEQLLESYKFIIFLFLILAAYIYAIVLWCILLYL